MRVDCMLSINELQVCGQVQLGNLGRLQIWAPFFTNSFMGRIASREYDANCQGVLALKSIQYLCLKMCPENDYRGGVWSSTEGCILDKGSTRC